MASPAAAVLSAIAHAIQLQPADPALASASTDSRLLAFVNEPSVVALQAIYDGRKLNLSNSVNSTGLSSGFKEVHLSKLRPGVLDSADLASTLLIATLVNGGHAGAGRGAVDSSGIFTLGDEFRHWEGIYRTGGGGQRPRADAFMRALEPIVKRFDQISGLALPAVLELVVESESALDDVWRCALPQGEEYPQHRMKHLLTCIGASLASYLQQRGVSLDIWSGRFNECRAWLEDGARLCTEWTSVLRRLTRELWPALRDGHAWSGEQHQDALLAQLGDRLSQMLALRTCHEELTALLPDDVQRSVRLADALTPLRRLNGLHVSAHTAQAWESAVQEYEGTLKPVDAQVASLLGDAIRAVADQPHQLLRVLKMYRHVRSRKGVMALLGRERDTVLARLSTQIGDLTTDVHRKSSAAISVAQSGSAMLNPSASNTSESVNPVSVMSWIGIVRQRAVLMRGIASDLLGADASMGKGDDLSDACDALRGDCDRAQKDLFRAWCAGVEGLIGSGKLSLDTSSRLMEFDADGNLRVCYSEAAVAVTRDVRSLTELGMFVPERITKTATDAERYYRFALQLQKVSSFYNTLGSEIIPSQKPMLLDPLLEFERAVQSGAGKAGAGAVTWSDAKTVSSFLDDLQRKAESLAGANRSLRKLHAVMCDEVTSLMQLDMLRQRDAWKGKWGSIRELFIQRTKQYAPDTLAKWVLHWDHQLYKAVEAGYRIGLESLNESLPEVHCELVYSQQSHRPAFRPSIEDLRASYYRDMRKFIGIPSSFGGLTGSNAHIFESMATKNSAGLGRVYHNAEVLFARVAKVRDGMKKWCVVGAVTAGAAAGSGAQAVQQVQGGGGAGAMPSAFSGDALEAYVDFNVRSLDEFDAAFTQVKVKTKELEKVPDYSKVDCVTIKVAPLKQAVEGQLQSLHDTLVLSLRKQLLVGLRTVEAFLEGASSTLSSRPASMADITKAKRDWNTLSEQRTAMMDLASTCDDQRKLLSAVVTGGHIDLGDITLRLGRLPSAWENLSASMESFGGILDAQREALKTRVSADIADVNVQLDKFIARWSALKPGRDMKGWSGPEVQAVFKSLAEWTQQLTSITASVTSLRESCDSFGLPPPSFKGLDEVSDDVTASKTMWDLYQAYDGERTALASQDWISFRSKLFDLQDFASKWADKVRGKTKDVVCVRIFDECEGIKKGFNALKFARGEPFKEEHWSSMFKRLGMPRGVKLDTLTVGHFLDVIDAVGPNLQWLKDLSSRAQGEVTIREALQELRAWGETAEFKLMEHISSIGVGRRTWLIREWKEVFTAVGDNQSLLQSLKESAYFKPFADTAAVFESSLATVDECAQSLNAIQRRWVYLEPVFGRGALPSEAARFKRVDEQFRDVMGKLGSDPKVMSLADQSLFPGLKESLAVMVDQLDRCQKALADFLEERRSKMPRFYFIGDDDLLEILGQSQNPAVIQSHLKKLYQGVHKVIFSGGGGGDNASNGQPSQQQQQRFITHMCSVAGEVVQLDNSVSVTDDVTQWLAAFTREMVSSLASLLVSCVRSIREGKESWESRLLKYPSQVLCLGEQIFFTEAVERILSQGASAGEGLQELKNSLSDRLAAYTSVDAKRLVGGSNSEAVALAILKVKALVLDVIHHLDVMDALISKEVKDAGSWHWQKQLRFYLTPNGRCTTRMVDAVLDYTFEYQGNAPKLVHTPLTDKCYLTLTQGCAMGYGGNPYGPAGTGKTETVKALGAAIGRQVLVFNCDEGLDFLSMGRIFTGLVKCGAWGCFDEFNRLREDQLSAVSQQIQVIQAAIKERQPSIALLGRNIEVNGNAGIFVTLNPAGKGYGGRSRLPDNLKALFRPVAMSKPDNDLIAEVILYSEGFMSAKELGRKMVALFTVASQLLSPQQHYDFGLRAMKACLTTGGSLISAARAQTGQQKLSPELECELLIKAVRVNTLSKLTFADAHRFVGLVADVFPGSRSEDVRSESLETAIRDVMTSKPFNLEFDAGQVRKMLQLKESLDQRMGCVIVGPSGCGKSTLWRMLQAAMIKMGQPVVTHVLNPKSMPRSRLLGEMDPDTREWTDGVLTAAARAVVKEPLSTRAWIVCDGDVDPEWIESLNSVLDDNHLLTLPNGERVSFGSNINFLFETHDLRFASPATISRMGMIFLSDDDVDVRRIVKCWLASPAVLPSAASAHLASASSQQAAPASTDSSSEASRMALSGWMEDFFYRALDWVRSNTKGQVVDTTLVGTVLNGLSHLAGGAIRSKTDFAVGLIRGLGGNLDAESRSNFARDVYSWCGERLPDPNSSPLDIYSDNGVLRPFVADTKGKAGSLTPGSAGSGGELTRSDVLSSAVVATAGVQRTAAVIGPWMERMDPFILVGPEGCGKSMLIKHLASQRRNTSIATLHCNAQTTAEHLITKIRQACVLYSSNTGRVFRPREGDRLILYLKDINLPKPDKYNTCGLVAFLQQLLTFRGFYDESLEFLGLERVHIVCSMNPATTVGRHALSTRFTASVRIAAMEYPEAKELKAILGAYLTAALGPATGLRVADERFRAVPSLIRLAETMVDVYSQVRSKFSVDEARHYLFTPRDLTSWAGSLLRYPLDGEKSVVDVCAYEACRLFKDRLTGQEARQRFDGLLVSVLKQQWGQAPDIRDVFFTALANGGGSKGGGGAASARKGASDGKSGGGDGHDQHAGHDGGGSGADIGVGSQLMRVDPATLKAVVERGLTLYEREERDLNLLLFPEALERIVQVDRVLSQAGGCMLLVGRPGVGRRSAVTLAAHMHGMHWVSPAIGRGYSLKQFYADVKQALQTSGVDAEDTVLYLEDHQIGALAAASSSSSSGADGGGGGSEAILEAVNSLLSSGEVPGLYSHEELEPLLAPLKEQMSDAGYAYRTPYDFFTSRVRARLHVCVAMDPSHPLFALRCERNPALFARCSVMWMGGWSHTSMRELASHQLADILPSIAPHVPAEEVIDHLVSVHVAAGGIASASGGGSAAPSAGTDADGGSSPRSFLALIKTFKGLYTSRVGSLSAEVTRLRAGLGKLQEAQKTVDELSTNANIQRGQLREKQAAADKAMNDITDALAVAADRRKETEVLQKQAARAEDATRARKGAIEGELAEIQPVLDAAKAALGNIRKENLDEIRALKMPPEAIADVLSAVLTMLGVGDTSWNSMKKFLGNRGVIGDILNYDPRSMTEDIRTEVGKILRAKAESFKHENIYRASVAAAPMAAWVKANVQYSRVLEKISPLEDDLAGATAELDQCASQLAGAQREIDAIDARVQQLKKEFGSRTAEAEALKAALARTEDTLHRAQSLLGQLSGERGRWETQAGELGKREGSLPLQVLLGAGFATYLTGHSEDLREQALHQWISILSSGPSIASSAPTKGAKGAAAAPQQRKPNASIAASLSKFDFLRLLSTESEMLHWKAGGMPADTLSMQNGVALFASATHSGRVPFILDPTSAATDWLQRHLEGDKSSGAPLEVLLAQDPRFANAVELAVRFGKTLLIRETDRVEPLLYPLLRKDLIHQGPRLMVQIGDKQVDYNEKFRLYMASRNPRPDLPPDAASLVSVVNFTVTRSGLEGQLLSVTLQTEQPELEARKSRLLRQEEELKLQLTSCEEDLLQSLASSTGSLLDNSALLDSLAKTKSKSEAIASALDGSARAGEELDRQRNVYRPFAAAGSRLFFVLQDLSSVNWMYQYSLSFFLDLFRATLAASHDGDRGRALDDVSNASGSGAQAVHRRIAAQVPALEARVLAAVGRSLLKADRLTFAIHMVHAMHPELFTSNDSGDGCGYDGDAEPGADPFNSGGSSTAEWRYFMGEAGGASSSDANGGGGARGSNGIEFPLWASPDRAASFRALADCFSDWLTGLNLSDVDKWGRWARSATPERDFPPSAIKAATPWQRVLMVQALRPDRMLSALQQFVCDVLGLRTITPAAPSLQWIAVTESAPTTDGNSGESNAKPGAAGGVSGSRSSPLPILMITTTGADPSRDLADFAANAMGREHYSELAMGGGQQDAALRLLRKAASDGDWLCLKNLHLVTSWLPSLEKELTSLKPHPRFRIWMTTECHNNFPAALLQQSVKITYEAPPGVRKNLERTFESWSDEYISKGSPLRASVLFLLAWFHAILQERRTYVPQGWTKSYEFSTADLRAGAHVIDTLLLGSGSGGAVPDRVPWAYLHGLMENSVYGGRVDNTSDIRVLRAYLASILHPEVLAGRRPLTRGLALPSPPSNRKADYMALIQSLPDTDQPFMFALPDNIERSVQRAAYSRVVLALKALRALSGSGQSFDREAWAARLDPLMSLYDTLLGVDGAALEANNTVSAASSSGGRPGAASSASASIADPLLNFLSMENKLAMSLVSTVHAQMTSLRKVLAGSAFLTPAIQATATALLQDAVPSQWSEAWPDGPESASAWLRGLASRRVALQQWAKIAGQASASSSANGSLAFFNSPIRLQDLFRPGTFLNALRQQTARRIIGGTAAPNSSASSSPPSMDALKLVCAWDRALLSRAPLPVMVKGILVQGAALDPGRSLLTDAVLDASEVQVAPELVLAWVPPTFAEPYPAAAAAAGSGSAAAATAGGAAGVASVPVPIYYNSDREKLLTEVTLPCSGDKARWILAGVALLLEAE